MAILTISREIGSGGREIGYNISRLLNYEYIDKEKIMNDIKGSGKKWEEWGKSLDEHRPTMWEKYDWSFKGFGALIQWHVLEYALKDKVVIIGRGGNFLLKGIPHALRIRVEAPIDMRVKRIVKRDSVDEKTARWLAEKTDKEREGFIYSLYGKHWNDTEEYDMVFNAGTKTIDEITDVVKGELIKRDSLNTEGAREKLRMLTLAAKVKAGILTNPRFLIPTLDVFHDGKELVLRGVIHNPKEHKVIEDEAKRLAEGVHVKCELHYRG